MSKTKLILIILTLCTTKSVGQKLIDSKYSTCDEGNPHKYKMNTMINRSQLLGDTLTVDITWIDNCAFEPQFNLLKTLGDTLYFSYKNFRDDETTCSCAFSLQFVLKNASLKNYQIKINNWTIDKSVKRYRTDGYLVEYYPERATKQNVLREIYSEKGKIIVEVYYDREGNIISEKYYNENWQFLERERKFNATQQRL